MSEKNTFQAISLPSAIHSSLLLQSNAVDPIVLRNNIRCVSIAKRHVDPVLFFQFAPCRTQNIRITYADFPHDLIHFTTFPDNMYTCSTEYFNILMNLSQTQNFNVKNNSNGAMASDVCGQCYKFDVREAASHFSNNVLNFIYKIQSRKQSFLHVKCFAGNTLKSTFHFEFSCFYSTIEYDFIFIIRGKDGKFFFVSVAAFGVVKRRKKHIKTSSIGMWVRWDVCQKRSQLISFFGNFWHN